MSIPAVQRTQNASSLFEVSASNETICLQSPPQKPQPQRTCDVCWAVAFTFSCTWQIFQRYLLLGWNISCGELNGVDVRSVRMIAKSFQEYVNSIMNSHGH